MCKILENNEEIVKLYMEGFKDEVLDFKKRRSAFRAEVCTLDWEDDGEFKIQGQGVKFLSSDKIRKNLAPLYPKYGIELTVEPIYAEFIKEDVTWKITSRITLEDVKSICTCSYTSIGMGGVGKNAITIGNTNAFKNWVTPTYQLADGIEKTEIISTYTPMSKDERDVVTSNVLSRGIKPDEKPKSIEEFKAPALNLEKTPATKKAIEDTNKPAEPKKIKEEPLPEEEINATSSDDTPPWEKPTSERKPPASGFTIPARYVPVVNMHLNRVVDMTSAGEATVEDYDRFQTLYDAINSDDDVKNFIKEIKAFTA